MRGTVVRNIHRADAGVIATLERLGVSTVYEAQGRSGLMQPYSTTCGRSWRRRD
jgi:4-hydroxy-4-methyl-2-oxoglutarate aldolase